MPLELGQIEQSKDAQALIGHSGMLSRPNCEVCPLRGSRIVPPNGNTRARIAIVGEGPGSNEESEGRGFIGKSGRLLDIMLERAGIDRTELWISNAACCVPRPVTLVMNQGQADQKALSLDTDTVKELSVRACRPRLLEELLLIQPKVIVPAGALAMWSLTGRNEGITARRGAIHQPQLEQLLEIAREDLPRVARLEPFPGVSKKRKKTEDTEDQI